MCHYIEAKNSREFTLKEILRSKEQQRGETQRRIISQVATADCSYKYRLMQKTRQIKATKDNHEFLSLLKDHPVQASKTFIRRDNCGRLGMFC
ncbi:hypothetical protein EAF04_006152 [Stromatinia cepivora]|nr:hypothetical protein EAF04_006152 [Stromatinia cepivora]